MERLLTLYSEVQSTDVRWLWYPFIAIGKITLLQGDPGDGKSTMMMNLIAELSTGGKTPDGCKIGTPQKVIYQCSEDGVSDTIKPRLERCGADCRKIAFINEEVYNGLTLDDERIRQAIIEFRPRLVVIDPIQAYRYFKDYHKELQTVCANVDSILGAEQEVQQHEQQHTRKYEPSL